MSRISSLPIAVRVYPEKEISPAEDSRASNQKRNKWRRPNAMLVFDTETRVDATQRLTFGSYQFLINGECQEEGLFFPNDLPDQDRKVLERYAAEHPAEANNTKLKLLTLNQFVSKFYLAVYKGRCLLVGFNLPFDLSRIARDATAARGRFAGGFSFSLWPYVDKFGNELENRFRPRICIKHIDGKRALKGFTARNGCDPEDLIPEGSPTGEPEEGSKFRGHFLDLRTLAFALTDRGYSLADACEAFEVEHGKQHAEHNGDITSEYIDYNRRDVLATAELAEKLLAEFDKHPIELQPTKAYSPASIGKAHLHAMGITPILERQPDFPKKYLGYAQSAFFGGRTSAHIRKNPKPVVYTDFLSMYPTVNINMGLWEFVTAREITIEEHCEKEITEFLNCVSADYLFNPDTWKNLTAFVQIIPDGDILPSRSKYATASNDWQVGVNHMYSDAENSTALWFALPDVVASVILTGRVPKIVAAFRLKAKGKSKGLKPISLRKAIKVDPRNQDLFKVVIEERKRLASRTDMPKSEKGRLDKALKVLANSTSYGIYAEMNPQESDERVNVLCHGIDPDPFTCKVKHPDIPGKYCFPPLAALITSGARLMLSLLEHCVSEQGGTYAMEDTDSMAIVATERGGLIPCPGGSYLKDGQPAIRALSWKEVEEIAKRFEALNPYDRDAIPGSVLKIEGDNFEPKTGKQRQLYCYAISAKRYALFLKDKHGNPELLRKGVNNDEDRWSEHGLGHLLNPTDPESDDRKWVGQVWLNMVRNALGLPAVAFGFEDRPAVGRVTVSSPAVIRPLAKLNEGKPYSEQIKPFNFLLTCHVKPFGHPKGADPEHFHLIAPYNNRSSQWLKTDWIDQYSGNSYRISTSAHTGSARTALVKTYGDVLCEYEFHPESKCADATGNPCDKQTVGLLQRRQVKVDQIKYIGKESNHLEEVDAGLVHSGESIYTEYVDKSRDEWQTKALPALKLLPLAYLVSESGLSRRALMDIRAGRSRPHQKNQERLTTIVRNNREDR
jgi:DNA polymerase type B, organellar and viral